MGGQQSGGSSSSTSPLQGLASGFQAFGQAVGQSGSQIPNMPSMQSIGGGGGGDSGVNPIPQDDAYLSLILQSLQGLNA